MIRLLPKRSRSYRKHSSRRTVQLGPASFKLFSADSRRMSIAECQQPLILAANDAVALARSVGEALCIENDDLAATGADEAVDLQRAKHFGDARPAHAKHLRQEFVRDVEFLGADTVLRRQKPPAAALNDRMQAVAGHPLHDLCVECCMVTPQQMHQRTLLV